MLLRVIPEYPDRPLEASLHNADGGKGHTGPAGSLAFHRTDIAQTDGVVGVRHVGPPVAVGVEEPLRPLVLGMVVVRQPGVGPEELIVWDVAELVDGVVPGLVPGHEGLVHLLDLVLVLLQGLGSPRPLHRVVNWREMEFIQELVLVQIQVGVQSISINGGGKDTRSDQQEEKLHDCDTRMKAI